MKGVKDLPILPQETLRNFYTSVPYHKKSGQSLLFCIPCNARHAVHDRDNAKSYLFALSGLPATLIIDFLLQRTILNKHYAEQNSSFLILDCLVSKEYDKDFLY